MRGSDPAPPLLVEFSGLGREKVKQQAIVQLAIDVMTLPLSADEAEAKAFYDPERRVMVYHPRIDRVQAEIAERKGHELLNWRGFGRIEG
jgi:hypothetical protein